MWSAVLAEACSRRRSVEENVRTWRQGSETETGGSETPRQACLKWPGRGGRPGMRPRERLGKEHRDRSPQRRHGPPACAGRRAADAGVVGDPPAPLAALRLRLRPVIGSVVACPGWAVIAGPVAGAPPRSRRSCWPPQRCAPPAPRRENLGAAAARPSGQASTPQSATRPGHARVPGRSPALHRAVPCAVRARPAARGSPRGAVGFVMGLPKHTRAACHLAPVRRAASCGRGLKGALRFARYCGGRGIAP